MTSPLPNQHQAQAILFIIIACFFVSIIIAIVRHLSLNFHVFFIVMMRNLFAFLFFMPLMLKERHKLFQTKNIYLHIFRNVNGLAAMLVWFYTVTLMPLPEAVSFTFIVPIITTLLAVFFLKEKVNIRVWIALIFGFLGILVIVRPGFAEFKNVYFLAFLTTILWSISNIVVKLMTKTDRPQTIVAYMSFITLIVSLPFGLMKLEAVSFNDLFWMAMLGLLSNLAHFFMSSAYVRVDLSVLQPFDFTRLIFTSIISYYFFQEVIDIYSILGGLIILIGTIIITPKKTGKFF